MQEVAIAFGLTLFAGMATAIGSVIAFTAKRTNYRFLSVATGFSVESPVPSDGYHVRRRGRSDGLYQSG